MKKSTLNLLVLLFSAFSACINMPCQAQTVEETVSNEISADNSNDNQNGRSPANASVDAANVQSTIISENSENTNPVNNTQTNAKPAARIPIGCRFFAAPSMQQ